MYKVLIKKISLKHLHGVLKVYNSTQKVLIPWKTMFRAYKNVCGFAQICLSSLLNQPEIHLERATKKIS